MWISFHNKGHFGTLVSLLRSYGLVNLICLCCQSVRSTVKIHYVIILLVEAVVSFTDGVWFELYYCRNPVGAGRLTLWRVLDIVYVPSRKIIAMNITLD